MNNSESLKRIEAIRAEIKANPKRRNLDQYRVRSTANPIKVGGRA